MPSTSPAPERFFVEIIKPSHYDDDGYLIQWVRAFVPSSSLAAVSAIAHDAKAQQALGPDVAIEINEYDEVHTVIPVREIIQRIHNGGGKGLIMLTGVQSNQFPRAADLANEFRAAGISVAIGGFHVSGCLSMLPEIPADIVEVQKQGVVLFAGEAEGRLVNLFRDAYRGELKPVYNYLDDLPALEGVVTPFLPINIARKSFDFTAFDAGRGCPFRCSFCTIINVQGRKSRHRNADDVERIVRAYAGHGVKKMFITDDNFSRNKNWEQIFDRLIELRQKEKLKFKLFIQVDTQCHKIPRFIEKASQAGCRSVFIGMETVNSENLVAAKKFQNRISEYRVMLQAWRKYQVLTHAGYILGFPNDTPESIERDIRTIQNELPIDILEFFIMTPLPGSADHQDLVRRGVPLDPDMNFYDTEHVTKEHERMTADEWRGIYNRAWHLYYSPEHVETMMRRAVASRIGLARMAAAVMTYYGSYRFENLHPLQCGFFRRKVRTLRRPTLPLENPLLFYPRRAWEILKTYSAASLYFFDLYRMRRRIAANPDAKLYTDLALTPPSPADLEVVEETCTREASPPVVKLIVPGAPGVDSDRTARAA